MRYTVCQRRESESESESEPIANPATLPLPVVIAANSLEEPCPASENPGAQQSPTHPPAART